MSNLLFSKKRNFLANEVLSMSNENFASFVESFAKKDEDEKSHVGKGAAIGAVTGAAALTGAGEAMYKSPKSKSKRRQVYKAARSGGAQPKQIRGAFKNLRTVGRVGNPLLGAGVGAAVGAGAGAVSNAVRRNKRKKDAANMAVETIMSMSDEEFQSFEDELAL